MNNTNKTFGILGEDLRQIEAGKILKNHGYDILFYKFDESEKNLEKIVLNSDYLILPLKLTDNNINLIKEIFCKYNYKEKIIFYNSEYNIYFNEFCTKNYFTEEFILQNALITAEGAIKIAQENSQKIINNSRILVTGYGRVGKILCKLLKNLGAHVAVYTKEEHDILWAKINQYEIINIKENKSNINFNLIFNTVPEIILNPNNLNLIKNLDLIIDLASNPGGVDKEFCRKNNINSIHALGIPGKIFPKSAGELVANTILKLISEENLWTKSNLDLHFADRFAH